MHPDVQTFNERLLQTNPFTCHCPKHTSDIPFDQPSNHEISFPYQTTDDIIKGKEKNNYYFQKPEQFLNTKFDIEQNKIS